MTYVWLLWQSIDEGENNLTGVYESFESACQGANDKSIVWTVPTDITGETKSFGLVKAGYLASGWREMWEVTRHEVEGGGT